MVPSSDFPATPSSTGESPEGVTDESSPPWEPADNDEKPTVTIEVSEEPVFIENVIVDEDTEGVTKVTVTVKDDNDEEVVSNLNTIFKMFITLWCTESLFVLLYI